MNNTHGFLRVSSLLVEASLGDDAKITPKTSRRAWDVFNELWFATDCTIEMPDVFLSDFGEAELHWFREPGHRLWAEIEGGDVELCYRDGGDSYFHVYYNGSCRVPEAILAVLRFFTTQADEAAK